MAESVEKALVRIRATNGDVVGVGFLVGPRQVLTCAHVVALARRPVHLPGDQPAPSIMLDFPLLAPQTQIKASVSAWCPAQEDERGDVAGLVLLDDPPVGAQAVPLVQENDLWNHAFRAFGCPPGHDGGVWTSGRLLGRQATGWIMMEDIKTEGQAITQGFSGGPVWDEKLQGVVGMVVASSKRPETKTSFALLTETLLAAWPLLTALVGPAVPRNPYKGLHAFTEGDAHDFFGRADLTNELADAMEAILTREKRENSPARLLAVIGASGSGKSSAVMAGLLPTLRQGGVLDSAGWIYLATLYPGAHPLEALAVILAKQDPTSDVVAIQDHLNSGSPRGLHLRASLLSHAAQQKVLLIVDQFEEVFTLTMSEKERQRFFELLVTAATEPRGPLFVVLTLRADFYDQPMLYPELYRLIDEQHISVLPMRIEELRHVIEKPARLPDVRLTFESGLIEELLFAMQGQSGALPLLQFTLAQLVQQRHGQQLTLQAYHQMGGVKGSLSQHAEETYKALPTEEHRLAAREVFARLIEPGSVMQEATRRRADLTEFKRADAVQTQRLQETLDTFTNARLLTTNQSNGYTIVEVSHEALIREWKRLDDWLSEAREDILFQQALSEDVAAWEQRKQPRDRLYRGARLKEAHAWASRNKPSKQETAFLQASARQRTLSRVNLVVVAFVLLSSLGATGWFFVSRPPSPTLVTTLQDNVNGSLRYCINNAPSGSAITFAQGLHGTIRLVGSLAFVGGKRLTLRGPGADQITISGGNTDAGIRVSSGATLTISGLSFKNNTTNTYAVLANQGDLTLINSVIAENKEITGGVAFGGGIYNIGTARLTIINSSILHNTIQSGGYGQGGGIYNEGWLTIMGSTISDNTTMSGGSLGGGVSFGGGIDNATSGTLSISNSTLSGNLANGSVANQGGGIYNDGTLIVTGSTFSNNRAAGDPDGSGGGIDNTGSVTVKDSYFLNNVASSRNSGSYGGGIANTGNVTVSNSIFSHNSTRNDSQDLGQNRGGGIDNDGKLTVTGSTFSNNLVGGSSDGGGGGIHNAGTLTLTDSTLSNNGVSSKHTSYGGGIDNAATLTITNTTLTHNAANSSSDSGLGGGISNYQTGTLIVTDSTLSGNQTSSGSRNGQGGGIYNEGKLTLTNSTIANNVASGTQGGEGGGIFSQNLQDDSAIIRFSTIYGNTANEGGGIWTDATGASHLTISSSIIADNNAQRGPDSAGLLNSEDYNLFQSVAAVQGLNATDKRVQGFDLKIDTTLRNNGGATQTLTLLAGSPAIDAVPLSACRVTMSDASGRPLSITTDQRGKPRPDGTENACDIGAYESSY